MTQEKLAQLVLRIGVAFSFLYPPFSALTDPGSWLGYFPKFLLGHVPDQVLLHGWGAIEVIIAIWILSGWRIFWPSLLAALMLVSIATIENYQFEILFRDLAIAAAALSLAISNFPTTLIAKKQ